MELTEDSKFVFTDITLELNLFVCVCRLCVHVKLLMFGMFYPECTIRTDSLAFFQSDTCLTPVVSLVCLSVEHDGDGVTE